MDKYLTEIRNALRSSAAHYTYFPDNKELRKERNIKLGHEIGYAVGVDDVAKFGQITYGILIVSNSFDRTGVAINMKEWQRALLDGTLRNEVL